MSAVLENLGKEIKSVKELAMDAGSDGKALLHTVKNAELLLSKARFAEAKSDLRVRDDLVEQIRNILG